MVISSFGNLAVERDHERMKAAYKNTAFVLDWIACIMCAGFIACIGDFITVVYGSRFVLDTVSVASLLLSLMFYLINIPIVSIQNAMGLHKLDSNYMIAQALTAILFGYIGGKIWRMPGIFFGLLIPLIIFTTIRKGVVISNKAFEMTKKDYLVFVFTELIKLSVTVIVSAIITSRINISASIMSIIFKGLCALAIGIVVPFIFSVKSKELNYALSLAKRMITRRR